MGHAVNVGIRPNQLDLRADRGKMYNAKLLAQLTVILSSGILLLILKWRCLCLLQFCPLIMIR